MEQQQRAGMFLGKHTRQARNGRSSTGSPLLPRVQHRNRLARILDIQRRLQFDRICCRRIDETDPRTAARPFSPSVRLSPNATYFVTLSRSGVSVTVNEHCACREAASTAVHETAVVPTLNELPDAGVQVVVTGVAPPVTVGGGYVIVCPLPDTPRVVMFAGHVMVGAAGCGAGSFGLLHADSAIETATRTQWAAVWKFLPSATAIIPRRCRDTSAASHRGTWLRPQAREWQARR